MGLYYDKPYVFREGDGTWGFNILLRKVEGGFPCAVIKKAGRLHSEKDARDLGWLIVANLVEEESPDGQ